MYGHDQIRDTVVHLVHASPSFLFDGIKGSSSSVVDLDELRAVHGLRHLLVGVRAAAAAAVAAPPPTTVAAAAPVLHLRRLVLPLRRPRLCTSTAQRVRVT
jgi:hypothetical protein